MNLTADQVGEVLDVLINEQPQIPFGMGKFQPVLLGTLTLMVKDIFQEASGLRVLPPRNSWSEPGVVIQTPKGEVFCHQLEACDRQALRTLIRSLQACGFRETSVTF